jgi:thymidylate synthase (FAD)
MKIIKQSWEFLREPNGEEILKIIEESGRTCYKSEEKITEDSARKFVNGIIKSGHHSVLEHYNVSARIITDRGVTHEIVRHRLVSYSQESTRYCNYSQDKFGKEITIILPVWFYDIKDEQYLAWKECCKHCESSYFILLTLGQTPQQARTVLPNSLKTEIVMTCNLREWRHFFTLRTSKAAHPQMRELATSMLEGFKEKIPVLFDDILYGKVVNDTLDLAQKGKVNEPYPGSGDWN